MGMAASQARYLALVARKTNCEYEGQQINQARTALSNQSANLFNQMLGLQVPIPPSTQDFTKTQYSFTDGINASTIDSWQQLATPEENYNYVVTHHYFTDRYTGSEKKLTDPQVQISGNVVTDAALRAATENVADKKVALDNAKKAMEDYNLAKIARDTALTQAQNLGKYNPTKIDINTAPTENTGVYTIEGIEYSKYSDITDPAVQAKAAALRNNMGITDDADETYYYSADGTSFIKKEELDKIIADTTYPTTLNSYSLDSAVTLNTNLVNAQNTFNALVDPSADLTAAQMEYDQAVADFEALQHPGYVGNCELTPLATLTADQEAEIEQIVKDMNEQGITSNIVGCYEYDETTGDYVYNGGIYSFKMNGQTYYTTYADLMTSYASGTGINNIDAQQKMPYYNASYISTKVEKTEKALLETDGNGRFSTIRFESDSITYNLKMETITDDAAYEDAMNQYYYENAKYDKMVQDINAKTSIIHQQDRTLELRLKQLETEQLALKTEIDAVQGIVKDNVEKSFKTFS